MATTGSNDYTLMPPHPSPQLLPSETRLGPVHITITDTANSRLFWTQYIGLRVIDENEERIRLGVGGKILIVLHPGASSPVVPRRTGLYHVAIHVPTEKELARICARLYGLGWEHAPTDHTETMATYTNDPDGNGIEITFETPERGSLARSETDLAAILADGTVRSGTEPLDVDALLTNLDENDDIMASMMPGSHIGHVHLHVNDMESARKFYLQAIGFGDLRYMARFRMSDFSLQSSYVPHALAINTWHGTGAQQPPKGTAGLQHWELILPNEEARVALTKRLTDAGTVFQEHNGLIRVNDPAGNTLLVRVGEPL